MTLRGRYDALGRFLGDALGRDWRTIESDCGYPRATARETVERRLRERTRAERRELGAQAVALLASGIDEADLKSALRAAYGAELGGKRRDGIAAREILELIASPADGEREPR